MQRTPSAVTGMKTVKVYGKLRELLGQCRFELDVRTPAQAFKALIVNFPQLERFILDSEKDGISYRMMVGRQHIGEQNIDELGLPFGQHEVFSIAPAIAGAGRSFGRFLIGAGLIGASFLFPGAGLFGSSAFGVFGPLSAGTIGTLTTVGTALSFVGASLILGGIAEIISPTPKPQQLSEAERLQSFSFSGIVNTTTQGTPVPVVLGRAYAGSVVISSGLDVV